MFLIAVGGFAGAICRYAISQLIAQKYRGVFPVGTFTVNLLGSLLLGLLIGMRIPPSLFFLLGVGFLGAFTTFSTFSLEGVQLLKERKIFLYMAYAGGSVLIGVLLAYLGFFLGNRFY
ncbi:MAG TPA: fluoride efflux transporter CrcB [Bacilli bacterium]